MSTQVSNKFKNLIFIFSSDSVLWFVTVFLSFQYSILFKQEHGEFKIFISGFQTSANTWHPLLRTNL